MKHSSVGYIGLVSLWKRSEGVKEKKHQSWCVLMNNKTFLKDNLGILKGLVFIGVLQKL